VGGYGAFAGFALPFKGRPRREDRMEIGVDFTPFRPIGMMNGRCNKGAVSVSKVLLLPIQPRVGSSAGVSCTRFVVLRPISDVFGQEAPATGEASMKMRYSQILLSRILVRVIAGRVNSAPFCMV
jgi:hypothetical protein